MQVQMGTTIKELRKQRGVTQEAMAEALGVTAQAVSRWESQSGYPDVEIIPAIAGYFGVTIDKLFGYEWERQQQVERLAQEILTMKQQNDGEDVSMAACIAAARNALIEFPGDEKLLFCLATSLYQAGYVWDGEHHLTDADGYDVLDVARHQRNAQWQEAVKIYEKLLTMGCEGEMRHTAIRELVQLYKNLGLYEKAKSLADGAPDLRNCRELLILHGCDGKAWAEEYPRVLGKVLSCASELLVQMVIANNENMSAQQAAASLEQAIHLFDCLEERGPYLAQIAHEALYLSRFQWEAGDRDDAFASLENARECAVRFAAIYHISEADIVAELPDVWPWWNVPDCTQVQQEIRQDPRWMAWEKRCRES